jgi:hypothetical protein
VRGVVDAGVVSIERCRGGVGGQVQVCGCEGGLASWVSAGREGVKWRRSPGRGESPASWVSEFQLSQRS